MGRWETQQAGLMMGYSEWGDWGLRMGRLGTHDGGPRKGDS